MSAHHPLLTAPSLHHTRPNFWTHVGLVIALVVVVFAATLCYYKRHKIASARSARKARIQEAKEERERERMAHLFPNRFGGRERERENATGGSTGGSRPGDHVELPVDKSAISVPRALKIETYVVYTLLTPIRC